MKVNFFKSLTKDKTYDFKEFSNSKTVRELDEIIRNTGERMEGNCLYQHLSDFEYHLENKEDLRYNLFTACKIEITYIRSRF